MPSAQTLPSPNRKLSATTAATRVVTAWSASRWAAG